MARIVRLGLVQMAMDSSAEKNREKASRMVHEAAEKGAEIVCLPELFTGPYFCIEELVPFTYAEPIPGKTSEFLAQLAREAKVYLVGGSFHEQALSSSTTREQFFNTSLVYSPEGQELGSYRKTHIPHDEGFFEQNYFAPGDTGFKVFPTGKAKSGVLICYDQWFPEAARANALLGADIVFYPTAIGNVADIEQTEGNWQEAWENVMRGHAIANTMIVAGVNRVGTEGRTTFWGGSFICDAFGRTLVRGGSEEEVIVHDVDLDHSKQVREGWRFFYNRRPESYGELVKKP